MKQTKLMTIVLVSAVVLIFLFATKGMTDFSRFTGTTSNYSGDKVKLDLYVMSQCPYGVQAENEVAKLMDKFGNYLDLNIEFIGAEENGVLTSLHGNNEVQGNIIQACVGKYYNDKLIDFIECQNKDMKSIPNNWKSCASSLGLDSSKLNTCYTSDEGEDLVRESFAKADKLGVRGSPTVYINDKEYSGARESLSLSIALCNAKDLPGCNNLPECEQDSQCEDVADKEVSCVSNKCVYNTPVYFDLTILNDKTCSSCDVSQITSVFKSVFKGANFKLVDISSEEGKKLVQDYDIVYVPAYIGAKAMDTTNFWKNTPNFASYFSLKNGNYLLDNKVVGSKRFVDEKLRQEYLKKLNISAGDNKPQIDFFVMSYCPYGNQAEELIYKVYQNLGDKVEFKPHYIYYPEYQGGGSTFCFDAESRYCSMHGVQEGNQNVREICVNKYYGIKSWFEFSMAMNAKCDYKNADSCWKDVAKSVGLDVNKIETCYNNERVQLAEAEIKAAELFGASGSPSIFVEGEEYAGARTANGYQTALCAGFTTKPAACNTVISEPAAQATSNNAGCGA